MVRLRILAVNGVEPRSDFSFYAVDGNPRTICPNERPVVSAYIGELR